MIIVDSFITKDNNSVVDMTLYFKNMTECLDFEIKPPVVRHHGPILILIKSSLLSDRFNNGITLIVSHIANY